MEVDLRSYHPGDLEAVERILAAFPAEASQAYFRSLGLPLRVLGDGVYPMSLRAESVLDVLQKQLELAGVEIDTETRLTDFAVKKGRLYLQLEEAKGQKRPSVRDISQQVFEVEAKAVLLASGGKTQAALGSDGSVLQLLAKKGLTIKTLLPALTTIALADYPKRLAGVRVRAALAAIDATNKQVLGIDAGEILFSKTGLSGIPTMQVSAVVAAALAGASEGEVDAYTFRGVLSETAKETLGEQVEAPWRESFAARAQRQGKGIVACLDLLPWLAPTKTDGFWRAQLESLGGDEQAALRALFPFALADYLWKRAKQEGAMLPDLLRCLSFTVEDVHGFEQAQVTAGGLAFEELREGSLSLKRYPGVFVCGEMLDVYGDCGGYNLQWAWSSAAQAALEIANFLEKES